MSHQLHNSLVRILTADGIPVGVGFVASENLILTCAHVIEQASGSEDSAHFDLPLLAPGVSFSGRVLFRDDEQDIATIEATGLPLDAAPVRLIQTDELWGHTFRAFGVPQGHDSGVWASGVLRDQNAQGWLHIEDVKTTGFAVQPGFSGGPVWDENLNAVVGMVVAAERDLSVKAAFCIPVEKLSEAVPALKAHSVVREENSMKTEGPFQESNIMIAGDAIGSTIIIGDGNRIEQKQENASIQEKHTASFSQIVPSLPRHFVPRREYTDMLESLFKAKNDVVLSGMPGVGKSVIASAFVQDKLPQENFFKDGSIWIKIGQDFTDLFSALEHIATTIGITKKYTNIENLILFLTEGMKKRQCLIVLDDIWDNRQIKPFFDITSQSESYLLITSRRADLANSYGAKKCQVKELNESSALNLLAKSAEKDVKTLPREVHYIIHECGNLPLAVSLCGAMVRDGDSWELVWERLKASDLREIENKFEQDYPYLNLHKAIGASIHALKTEFTEKYEDRKFARELIELYYTLGIFKTGESIPENVIVNFWASVSSLTTYRAKGLLNKLKNRNLLNITGEEPYRRIELHDLQHDFVKAMLEKEENLHRSFLRQYNPDETPWYEIHDDGYIQDHLVFHLIKAGKQCDVPTLFSQEKWVRSRDLAKLLADFQEAKDILDADDFPNRIRYKLYGDVIRDRYSGLPVEIAKEMVIRNLVEPDVFVSVVDGMNGSADEKIDVYLSIVKTNTIPTALKENFSLEAFAYVQKIYDAETQSAIILQLYDYLSTTEKRKKYRMLWNAVFDIQNNDRRNQALTELLQELSEQEKYQLVNDFLNKKNIPTLRSIYLINATQNFIQKNIFSIKKMWQSVLSKVLNDYIKDEKAFLLASIAMRMPSYIAIDLSSHVWESLNECEYWENGGSYYDEDFFGEIFNPLMPYINIKDVGALWERAKHEFEEETWGGQQALMAVLKNWMFFDDEQGYIKEVQDDMVNYFKSLLPEGLHYQQKINWAEIRIKQLEAISDAETLFNGWFEIYKIALTLRPDWARDRGYNKFLENCGEALPPKITLRIWTSLINNYAMKIVEQEDKGGQHWQYDAPLISLIKKVPKEHALKAMQLAFKFKTKYPSLFINIFPHTIGQLLIRINDESKQYWWNKAKEETFNKYYGTPAFSVLLKIIREVPETEWKKKQLERLIDELVKHFDGRYPVLVQDYFPYIPETSRSIALKKILAKVSSHDNVDVFWVELLRRQPEFIQNVEEIVNNQEKFYGILAASIGKRDFGRTRFQNSEAFMNFLQKMSQHNKKELWELISNDVLKKYHARIEILVIFIEEMNDEERTTALPQILSNSWREDEAEKYFALAAKNWSGKTIWKVWQYMYNFDPNGEWPYCLWALALAPHIPTDYLSQAFEMALEHTPGWPKWTEISTVLAKRLPNQFADSMWGTLEDFILEADNSYIQSTIRSIQVALISSVSDNFLVSLLQAGSDQNKTQKRMIAKTNFIGGNMIDYFRHLLLLSFPKNIPTQNKNDTLLSQVLNQYKKIYKVHRRLAGVGSVIFASMITLTYPIVFPILRFLYKRKDDGSFYLPFFFESTVFIAKDISNRFSILFSGRGKYISPVFSRHVEFSEEKIFESRMIKYFRDIFLGAQFIASIPLGIILFFVISFIRLGLFIFFVDIFTAELIFGGALNGHLLILRSSSKKDLLRRWLDNKKEYDVFALRPLFDQAGGKKLRRIAAIAYQDANTWWYDVIANPQNIFGKDGV